jgi:hypothetical protein
MSWGCCLVRHSGVALGEVLSGAGDELGSCLEMSLVLS